MAYFGQPRGCYFDSSHDDQAGLIRDGIREQEKQLKRQKQADIAEELSMITSDEYREDHLEHMEAMEVKVPDFRTSYPLLTCSAARNTARCCLDRGTDRDPMVHASISSRLLD